MLSWHAAHSHLVTIVLEKMLDKEPLVLDPNIDSLSMLAIEDLPSKRVRKTSKRPPTPKKIKDERPKAKAKIAKPKSKKMRRAIEDDDDDDDEKKNDDEKAKLDNHEGEDENPSQDCQDGEQEEQEGKEPHEEEADDEEKISPEGKNDEEEGEGEGESLQDHGSGPRRGKAKAKAKPRGKAKAKAKSGLRDQSKNRKFMELFHELPGSIQKHFNGLSRSAATDFVHAGVQRDGRRLSLNPGAMFEMKAKREEMQKGEESMTGLIVEEPRRQPTTQDPLPLPYCKYIPLWQICWYFWKGGGPNWANAKFAHMLVFLKRGWRKKDLLTWLIFPAGSIDKSWRKPGCFGPGGERRTNHQEEGCWRLHVALLLP